jgi:hypothetical protein
MKRKGVGPLAASVSLCPEDELLEAPEEPDDDDDELDEGTAVGSVEGTLP